MILLSFVTVDLDRMECFGELQTLFLLIVPALLSIRRPEGPFFAPTELLLFDEVIELRYVIFLLLLAAGLACR